MMKKVLLLVLVSSLSISASAGLTVVVAPVDNPYAWAEWADSKLVINPSDELLIGFADDSGVADVAVGDVFYLGISQGPGAIDAGSASALPGVSMVSVDNALLAADMGIQNNFLMVSIEGEPVSSMLAHSILFHCEGEGDVTFFAFDENYLIVDTQVIHQTPEPATLALLGLGGLFTAISKKRKV